ncbi:hypothetical protein RJ641_023451 [Dillenia turbinata]|uniref:Bystin n=1 Tax=Dillenia turbinata TaxID=194707 RepID=A0AAN8YVM6_9MAGN
MAKRSRNENPQPFMLADDASHASKKKTKPPKLHQKEEKMISSNLSSKILKGALLQQKEIENEENKEQNPNSFLFVEETNAGEETEDDIDNFTGFSETQSNFGGYDEEIDEEDEKLLEAFMKTDAPQQRTLADLIVAKISEHDAKELDPCLIWMAMS